MSTASRRPGLIIALVALGIYALIPTRDFYWDGVGFAQAIETGGGSPGALLNPNHLIYTLAGYLVWKGLMAVGIALRALFVLQALNAVFAAAAVYLAWDIIRKLTGSLPHANWGSLLFAFSAQWWKFSSDADAYIPSIFFLLVSFRWIMTAQQPRHYAAAAAHSVAMLFHQLAFFFFPVALAGLLVRPELRSGEKRKALLDALSYGALATTLTGTVYWLAYRFVRPYVGSRGFFDWITVYSPDAALPIALYHRFRYSIRGTLRLFFGGRINRIEPDAVMAAGVAISVLALAAVTIRMLRSRRHAETAPPGHASPYRAWLAANRPTICWILAYMAFLFFWLPQNVFYRMFYLPPLLFMLLSLPALRAHRVMPVALLATIVCAWNFNVLIYPHSRIETNEVLSCALTNRSEWKPGTTILYGRSHTDLWLISYFNPQVEWTGLPAVEVAEVERQRLRAAQNARPLWLEGMGYDELASTPAGQAWLARHVNEPASHLHVTPAHNIRYYKIQ